MKHLSFLFIFFFCAVQGFSQSLPYTIADTPWEEQLGNHRALMQLSDAADAVAVTIKWRRRDRDAAEKSLIITDETGNQVKNIFRVAISREEGTFVFQPVKNATRYFVYYMPWSGGSGVGYFNGRYLKQEPEPDRDWVARHNLNSQGVIALLPKATVMLLQSRTAFDSFYPMEVVASDSEIGSLHKKYPAGFLLFPEKRTDPIRMMDDLPYKWITTGPRNTITDTVLLNEYYAFQLGLYASKQNVDSVSVSYKNNAFALTCFNTEGVNADGIHFKKQVNVTKGRVQPLWFGVDIPANAPPGLHRFQVLVRGKDLAAQTIDVSLYVKRQQIKDRGDGELWRHSRLRWLNSRLGNNDAVVQPYKGLRLAGTTINATTATVSLQQDGFIRSVLVNGEELLRQPLSMRIMASGEEKKMDRAQLMFTKKLPGRIEWEGRQRSGDLEIVSRSSMEFDGYVKYKVLVKALKDVQLDNIALDLPVNKATAKYFMGMGLPGGDCPADYDWKWKGPQDSYWIGNVNAGIFCELRGATYSGPLLNLYHPAPPPTWYNNNLGGFTITGKEQGVTATTYTGQRHLRSGDTVQLEFALLITPVKKIDTRGQFANRYYHNGGFPDPSSEDVRSGIKFTNVHHANPVNPFINYPFISVDSIKNFASRWHQQGVKTKIYYTIRELSNQAAELWALRSLGDEVLGDGNGGGYTWLREHLVGHYNPQWFTPVSGTDKKDAAVLTSGKSRWYNYYIEGLRWMAEKTGIDGLYLDDVAFDRDMLKRMRRVLDMVKPGCVLDLHSNTGFSKGPATQYLEFFPYIDKLWFGESFQYSKMAPANWLVEVSGIPFGLMGDMLHAGGNPWRGMVYGMTVRYPWFTEGVNCDPREIWKVWDRFGIADAKMKGYWDKGNPVSTGDPKVLATAYIREDSMLVAVASWNKDTTNVNMLIDEKLLGWKPGNVVAPAIPAYQPGGRFHIGDGIPIAPLQGWLLIYKKNNK